MVKLQKAYKTILGDHFPATMEIHLGDKVLKYEKVGWDVEGETKGLRYGDNPGQEAALFKFVGGGNFTLDNIEIIQPGKWLASDVELLQSGKHPGKTNITDADNALNILRYFLESPVVSIMKHGNPCGVAIGESLEDAYNKANLADRVAAFGGTIGLNRTVDLATAEAIAANYSEVVVAPEFEEGVMNIFAKKKNLRVMRIQDVDRLYEWIGEVFLDFKALMDGGIIVQSSYVPQAWSLDDIRELPLGYHERKKEFYQIGREPSETELKDMWFGWLVESGITSNSVIYVKNGVTLGIGTGEQDRLFAAKIARQKAEEKLKDRISFERFGVAYEQLHIQAMSGDEEAKEKALRIVTENSIEIKEVLHDAVMVSDAFFPFRDGIEVGLQGGVKAVIQPGGSINDYQAIEVCNEYKATMLFTGQRSFKH